MAGYESIWPIIRHIPPELAHQMALVGLRMPALSRWELVTDPFEWHGLRFRNRVGIAAGFDKNGVALRGIELLGSGFVEVGTILVKPWGGNKLRPRVKRIIEIEAIWNRLRLPSHGLERISKNLKAFPQSIRNGLVVGCNIGPHPGNLQAAKSVSDYHSLAYDEMLLMVTVLFDDADFFVVNLSSPNTPELRNLLQCGELSERLFLPLRQAVRRLDSENDRPFPTPFLVKLPPEDADQISWSPESLKAVVGPLIASDACDGFVAVNASSRLAAEIGEDGGGISGKPLRTTALEVIRNLRQLIGPSRLIVGSGGITAAEHAAEFIDAGSNLVEMYSGLVYRGPGLLSGCAAALREHSHRPVQVLS